MDSRRDNRSYDEHFNKRLQVRSNNNNHRGSIRSDTNKNESSRPVDRNKHQRRKTRSPLRRRSRSLSGSLEDSRSRSRSPSGSRNRKRGRRKGRQGRRRRRSLSPSVETPRKRGKRRSFSFARSRTRSSRRDDRRFNQQHNPLPPPQPRGDNNNNNNRDAHSRGHGGGKEFYVNERKHHFELNRQQRRSYSSDRRRQRRRRRSSRRRRQGQQRYRLRSRSRSFSSSSSSFSSSLSSAPRRRIPQHLPNHPRPPVMPTARAGVVSDDDDMMMGNSFHAFHGQGSGAGSRGLGGGMRVSGGNGDPLYDHSQQQRAHVNNKNANEGDRYKSYSRKDKTLNKRGRDSAQSSSQTRDDTIGHFWGGAGTVVADRYRVERELGVGTFGRVVECLDLHNSFRGNCAGGGGKNRSRRKNKRQQQHDGSNSLVAIKMVRSIKRYYESALIEADIVSNVNRRGGRGTSHFAVMFDAFNFHGHYCLVFESLGPSLYDYLKQNKYQPFPMDYIRDISRQLLEALEFLHSFRLIHTDLKPENILVTKCRDISYGYQKLPESTRIKIIDFGGATFDYDKKSSIVNTRQYRAPEVILSCGWSMPSDLWSAGCILAELYQGELLFATHDNLEHLALIEWIIGPFPRRMLHTSLANQAFNSNGRHRMERVLPSENASYVLSMPSLESVVRKKDGWFLNLLRSILVIDPENRFSARDALRSPFG